MMFRIHPRHLGENHGEDLAELIDVTRDLVVAVVDLLITDLVRLVEYHVLGPHVPAT